MAALRAIALLLALLGFFLLAPPLQWLIARKTPARGGFICLAFCRSLLWLLKVRVVVEGTVAGATAGAEVSGGGAAMETPVLLAANHVSWIDILVLGGIEPFCFLSKSEVSSWPMVSALAGVQGTVFVDRKRRRGLPQANRELALRMLEGRKALLFPEGTTVAPPLPDRFLSSHFAAARDLLRLAPERGSVAVQPVAIAYSSADAAWIGDDDLVSHLWRTLRAPPLICTVAFGRPIDVRPATNRKDVARLARDAVIAMIGERGAAPVTRPAIEIRSPEPMAGLTTHGRGIIREACASQRAADGRRTAAEITR